MSETTEDARICTHGSGNRMTCQLCILEVFQMRTPAEFASALAAARAQLAEAAREINVSGPVAHRIRVLRRELSNANAKLAADLAAVRDTCARASKEARTMLYDWDSRSSGTRALRSIIAILNPTLAEQEGDHAR